MVLSQAATPLAIPTTARYRVLGFACSLALITYLDRICIMRAKGPMREELGFSDLQLGFILSAFSLGYALFEVPVGWMGDKWGARRVLTRIVLSWSLFTAMTGLIWKFSFDSGFHIPFFGLLVVPLLFDSLVAMLLVRFFFGIGEAGAFPNLTRVVRDWFPAREQAFAQGMIWMSARIGGAVAPVVTGQLTATLGWRQTFWVLGAIGMVWAVAFHRWFRNRPEEHPGCNELERREILGGRKPEAAAHDWPPLGALLRSKTVWALCLASFCVCFGWYFYPTWQPEFFENVYGIDIKNSEIRTGLPFLCGAVGAFLGGSLSDWLVRATGSKRWGRSILGAGGFFVAGLCVLGAGFAPKAWQATTLLCLGFMINDLAIPGIWAACADVGGRFAGTVAGVMNMAGGVGAILVPSLIPYILMIFPESYEPAYRWRLIFAGLAVSWFVGALAWLFVDAGTPLEKR
jgi:MFS family permease